MDRFLEDDIVYVLIRIARCPELIEGTAPGSQSSVRKGHGPKALRPCTGNHLTTRYTRRRWGHVMARGGMAGGCEPIGWAESASLWRNSQPCAGRN